MLVSLFIHNSPSITRSTYQVRWYLRNNIFFYLGFYFVAHLKGISLDDRRLRALGLPGNKGTSAEDYEHVEYKRA